jgi:putative two-component system response regulator
VTNRHADDTAWSMDDAMDDASWTAMARHTEIGARIMGIPDTPVMKLAAVIAESHHERWDGEGYPSGLRGEEIPLEGRITAVADSFDRLTNKRARRATVSAAEGMRIIQAESGHRFDPRVVDAFGAAADEILRVHAELAEGN